MKAFEKTAFQFFGFRLEDWSQAKSGFVAAYMKAVTFGLFHPEARRGSANLLGAETVRHVAVAHFEA